MDISGLYMPETPEVQFSQRRDTNKLLMHLVEAHQEPHFRNEDIGTPKRLKSKPKEIYL